jgi:hypothetical protein
MDFLRTQESSLPLPSGRIGSARPKWNQVPGKRGRPQGSEETLNEEYLLPRETEGGRDG